jgi:phosphomevalonate kinase
MHLSIDAGELYTSEGIKLGLGSSAAVTVALMTGMYAHLSARQPKRSQIFDMALAAHRHLQNGRGSGLDVAASVFGGTIEFQLSQDQNDRPAVHPVRLPGRMFLSTVWTGQPASTPQMLNALEAFRDDQGSRYRDVLEALAATARRGTEAFHREDVVQFFKAVEGYHQQLTRLSEYSGLPIVSEEHSSLAAIARDNGGVYKPSGAGGGDIGIAFADTARKAERISLAMTDAGFRVLDLEWGAMGVRF